MSTRVLFRVEVKDCVLPKAPAVLINAPLSICFEHGHKLAATSDRSLLTKAGEDSRVSSFPRETLALVVVLNKDAQGRFIESLGSIVVRMRRVESNFKGLAVAQLPLHQILENSKSSGGVSGELKVPLTQCPWPLTEAEAKNAFIIVTVTSKIIGEATAADELQIANEGGHDDEISSADFGYDSDNDRLNPPAAAQQALNSVLGPTGAGLTLASMTKAVGAFKAAGRSAPSSSSSSAGSTSPSRLKSSNPYTAAINAAVASTGAFKKKCDAMSGELRVLKREYEESSKLKQALKALQAKFDKASRDLAEQAEIVSAQTNLLRSKSSPELASAVAAAKEQALRERERLSQDLEYSKKSLEETSLTLLKVKHQYAGSATKAQVAALHTEADMTKAQLKASLDLIDAMMQLPTEGGEAGGGLKEDDLRAILTAASARGKEFSDATHARDELQQQVSSLSRQIMAMRRKGAGALTYGSVVNAASDSQSLEGWGEAQFSDWTEREDVIRVEADSGDIFLPEAPTISSSSDASEELLALESKLQTCTAQLKLRDSQLATSKGNLDSSRLIQERQKAEIAELTAKLQSGLAFISSIDAKLAEKDKVVADSASKLQRAQELTEALQDQLAESKQELEAARARASSSAKQIAFSPSQGPPPATVDAAAALVAEYEEKLQQAGAYIEYQESEIAKERNRAGAQEQRAKDLERQLRDLDEALAESRAKFDALNPGGIHHFSASVNSAGPLPSTLKGGEEGDAETMLRDTQDRLRVLKRDSERQKLEIDELRDLLLVRDEHIKGQQKKLMALEAFRTGGGGQRASADPEGEESYEAKDSDREGRGKWGKNKRVTELEDELTGVLLKNRAQDDKLTKAAEYIKYQKEQLSSCLEQLGACTAEITSLREQLDAVPVQPEGPSELERELTAEIEEVRRFAEEFETKLVEAAEFIDQQAAEIVSLQGALDKERRERLAAITVKTTVTEVPKQPALPYLNSRNDPENIDFDECMDYLRKIDAEASRARNREIFLATENLGLQGSLKQALAAAASAATPIYHAPAAPASVQTFPSQSGTEVAAQVREARDIAKKLAAEKNHLETQLSQLREQVKNGGGGGGADFVDSDPLASNIGKGRSGKGGNGLQPQSASASKKYDDFDTLVNDLISLKYELSSTRDELEESQRKNKEAAESLRIISQLKDELSSVNAAKAAMEKKFVEGALNPFSEEEGGGSSMEPRSGGGRASFGLDDGPLLIEARDTAKRYFGELQAAKLQISALSAKLSAARVVKSVAASRKDLTPGEGPVSDAEREALVKELIDTKMQIDALTSELEDERGKTHDLVARLNDSTKKIATLEARLGNSAGSHEPSRSKGIPNSNKGGKGSSSQPSRSGGGMFGFK